MSFSMLVGCASGATPFSQEPTVDANETTVDAQNHPQPHPDAPPLAIDAFESVVCVPQTTELLTNPVFDLTPVGSSWTEQPFNAQFPLVTNDGLVAQSMPYKVWLGGFEAALNGTATDVLHQDVLIPAGTTQLVLSGFNLVGTNELPSLVEFDHAAVDLIRTNGTPIENVLTLSNLSDQGATTWSAFSHTFTANLASLGGQTVRLRLTSSNDDMDATNFFFDTLSLQATYCP